jgi:predicted phage terminase large subunit-like protein
VSCPAVALTNQEVAARILALPPKQRQRAITLLRAVTPKAKGSVLPFGAWLEQARPEYRWDAPHFRLMQSALDEMTGGTAKRIILSVAIRHGKTETVTSYAAKRLEDDPSLPVLVGTYNQQQADKLSRQIRSIARARGVAMSEDRDAAREWETTSGGGVRAVGAGSGVASVNAGLIIIDDPIGSRDEAESQAHRDRVFDWITNDILARCVPGTGVIVSHPRWHQDDPIGRLRDRQGSRWRVIDLPGRAEENDPLGRPLNAPLWPDARGEDWLNDMRTDLGEYGFASLMQGRPRPREGGMFQWKWWQLIEDVPMSGPMVRYWDLAGTEPKGRGHDPDYSAGALLCRMPDQRTAIVDIARFRKSIAARDAELERIAMSDLQQYRGRIHWWIETEAGIAGEERTAALVRRLQNVGMPVSTEHPTGKKIHRAEPLASKAEAGNVVLCPGEWRDGFRAEAADFPNGTHDDQIDATAGADSKLAVRTAAVAFHFRA